MSQEQCTDIATDLENIHYSIIYEPRFQDRSFLFGIFDRFMYPTNSAPRPRGLLHLHLPAHISVRLKILHPLQSIII
jgi:hypothetical protein